MPRLPDPRFAPDCAIRVDGRPVPARAGESVAAALVAAGRPLLARSYKYHRPRGPFCLAGSCGSCLVRAEGLPNQRACRTPCRDGLAIETQNAVPDARHDLLAVVDRLTPGGLDHHHLLTRPRLANRAVVALSRRLAGLGRLPDAAPPPPAPAAGESFEAIVVGAGPAGLGAAEALAAAGRRVLLVEEERALGGRLRARLDLEGDPPLAWAAEVASAVAAAGGEVSLGAAAVGIWRDGGEPLCGILAGGLAPRLRLVRSPRLVLCPGGTAQPPLFAGSELPGVFGARGLLAALAEHGVVAGERALVLGSGPEASAAAARLAAAGMACSVLPGGVAAARGRLRVGEVALEDGRRLRCDTVVAAAPPAPACDLARAAGAALAFDPSRTAHAVRAGPDGETGVPGLWVAGEATSPLGAGEAARAGRRAGEAASRG